MSARILPSAGKAAADTELLARLGLPASASPEDVDNLHRAVSEFLAAAPNEIHGWAHAQVAALDAAYITLTDPVGLEGSALTSPASPPTVVPGGPVTPPARRGPAEDADNLDDPEMPTIEGEATAEDLAAMYAMVTPSAHEDMKPQAHRALTSLAPTAVPHMATPLPAAPATGPNIWKRIVIGAVGIAAVFAIGFGANAIINPTSTGPVKDNAGAAQATPGAPAIDQAKVAGLMTKLQADPNDTATLLTLADEFYAGGQYETAATWLDKYLALKPDDIQGLLARGAVYFNLDDLANAKSTWTKVAGIDPKNVEVHYDLGFLYLNQPTPNWTGVQTEWNKVIELDPSSQLAQTVRSHLDSLAASSMIPEASAAPAASPATSPAASSSPAASPAASSAASPATTPAP